MNSMLEIKQEVQNIIKDIDRLNLSLAKAEVAQYGEIFKWKVELAYSNSMLMDQLTILTVIFNELVNVYVNEGDSLAKANNKADNDEVGRMIIEIKNKLRGSEKILTHSRDHLKSLEDEKFNQY